MKDDWAIILLCILVPTIVAAFIIGTATAILTS